VDGPDLAAIAASYVFAIHLALGLWAVGAALSRFGSGGGGGGGGLQGGRWDGCRVVVIVKGEEEEG
jgi:hypothetical protein